VYGTMLHLMIVQDPYPFHHSETTRAAKETHSVSNGGDSCLQVGTQHHPREARNPCVAQICSIPTIVHAVRRASHTAISPDP